MPREGSGSNQDVMITFSQTASRKIQAVKKPDSPDCSGPSGFSAIRDPHGTTNAHLPCGPSRHQEVPLGSIGGAP